MVFSSIDQSVRGNYQRINAMLWQLNSFYQIQRLIILFVRVIDLYLKLTKHNNFQAAFCWILITRLIYNLKFLS